MDSDDNKSFGDQAYIGFRDIVLGWKKINFTDTFFYYLMGEDMTAEEALLATVDLRYHSHTNRCEKVRGQGNSCSGCKIPPQ
ncbi:hypothetical protein HQ563_06530 [bacterium]|nr:hypothetical protein [bacterium]